LKIAVLGPAKEAAYDLVADNGHLAYKLSCETPIGAALFVFRIDGQSGFSFESSQTLAGSDVRTSVDENLLASSHYECRRQSFEAAGEEIFSLHGVSTAELISQQVVDENGCEIAVVRMTEKSALPSEFELSQNYPKSFQPGDGKFSSHFHRRQRRPLRCLTASARE